MLYFTNNPIQKECFKIDRTHTLQDTMHLHKKSSTWPHEEHKTRYFSKNRKNHKTRTKKTEKQRDTTYKNQ